MRFAARAQGLKASVIRDLFDLGQRDASVIDLAIGQTDFDVPAAVKQAAREGMDRASGRYSPTEGYPEVVDDLRWHLRRSCGLPESRT